MLAHRQGPRFLKGHDLSQLLSFMPSLKGMSFSLPTLANKSGYVVPHLPSLHLRSVLLPRYYYQCFADQDHLAEQDTQKQLTGGSVPEKISL